MAEKRARFLKFVMAVEFAETATPSPLDVANDSYGKAGQAPWGFIDRTGTAPLETWRGDGAISLDLSW
jgi:hypothetical protein